MGLTNLRIPRVLSGANIPQSIRYVAEQWRDDKPTCDDASRREGERATSQELLLVKNKHFLEMAETSAGALLYAIGALCSRKCPTF